MRLGAAVHSASPAAAERPQWLYLGSCKTLVSRLRRISSVVGRGASQSCEVVSVVGDRSVFSGVGESDSMESLVVTGWMPVSAMTNITSGALWRAPPPLGRLADDGMNKLTGRVVAANAQGLMDWTFPCNMGA
jgi:hypothetical protein